MKNLLKSHFERKKEIQKRKEEAKNIIQKIIDYLTEEDSKINLQGIIEEANFNDFLSKQLRFNIILENIKEYNEGESEFEKDDIVLDLYDYMYSF